MTLRRSRYGPRPKGDNNDYVIPQPPFLRLRFPHGAYMPYERSSARMLLSFILITPILRLAFASQAVFAANATIRVPVSLGITSRDGDALYVQTVFDKVLKQVSDKVDMNFAYVKECVFLLYLMPSTNLMRAHNVASGPTTRSTGCGVLQTGWTARVTCNSCACANIPRSRSGGISSCVKTERERRKLVNWKSPRSVP